MEHKNLKISAEEQLLDAREKGLQEVAKINPMSAHGKVLGMDTFSWVNPHVDSLATLLDSFPFSVVWIGSNQQVVNCLANYPKLATKIQSVIVYESKLLKIDRQILHAIKNIICVDGVTSSLELVKSLNLSKMVFLFTSEGDEANAHKEEFTQFISQFN